MINTVLFDFDGTLMNTRDGIIKSWKHTFRTIAGKEITEEDIQHTLGEPLKVTLAKFFPEVPVEESIKIYREYKYLDPSAEMYPFEGVVEVVNTLHDKGCKVGVVTSRLGESLIKELEKINLLDKFDVIISAETCEKHKPNPEPIYKALEILEVEKENALMVGDTMYDLKAAKNAGVKGVLVGWSFDVPSIEAAGGYAPAYRIEKAEELLDIVEV